MANMFEEFDQEAVCVCNIIAICSRLEELVDHYPKVKERINDFFESASFEAMFSDMMDFVRKECALLGISREVVNLTEDVFMYKLKQNLKANILMIALGRIFTLEGKYLEDIEEELLLFTERTQIENMTYDYIAHLKSHAEDGINGMFKSDYTS